VKKFLQDNFPRIDPSPFFIWAIGSSAIYQLPINGVERAFLENNATIINLIFGAVISAAFAALLIILLLFLSSQNRIFSYAHWISKLFSDTALGSAGFIFSVELLINNDWEHAAYLSLTIILYVILINHLFMVVFDDNTGTLKLVKSIDRCSDTEIPSREIHIKTMAFAVIVSCLVAAGILFNISQLKA